MGTTNMDRTRGMEVAYWIRRRSDGEPPPLVRTSSMSTDVDDDPLVYRLLHQKELSTRRKQKDSLGQKSVDDIDDNIVIDPFDMWESFTSEENSCKCPFYACDDDADDGDDDSDECITSRVDVKGWETRRHGSESFDQTWILHSQPKRRHEEEEDPRISQLNKQSTKELREVLVNMQHRAKCNLEKTWEVAEQTRAENSTLDDQLEDLKGKLRSCMLPVEFIRQISAQSEDQEKVDSEYSFKGRGDFIEKRRSSSSKKLHPRSNFRPNYGASAPRTSCDKSEDGDEDFNGVSNPRKCCSRYIQRGSISEIDEELYNSLLSQDMVTSMCNSCDDSYCDTLDESCDTVNGVYYPALDINSHSLGDDFSHTPAAEAVERIVLDDFDFDPLHTLSETDPTKGRDYPVGRRTLLSLFGERKDGINVDDFVTASLRGQDNSNTETKTLICERENEFEQMTRLVQTQKEEILAYEKLIANLCDKCHGDEKLSLEKQSRIQREVEALQLLYAELELRLYRHKMSLRRAEKNESSLKQLKVAIDQMCLENKRALNLEARLSWCQHQYKASQEIATETLSALLNDVNGMCIPSLREEDEGDVPGEITARFQDLAVKEEELVKVLCSPDRALHTKGKLKNGLEV
jgi:hypothetical protein